MGKQHQPQRGSIKISGHVIPLRKGNQHHEQQDRNERRRDVEWPRSDGYPGPAGSLDRNSPLHPRNGKPKNFQIADNVAAAHGVFPSDVAKGVLGAHKGHHPDPADGHGVPVHPGMLHVNRGTITAGISKTQKAFDDEPNTPLPTSPKTVFDELNHERPRHYSQTGGIPALAGRGLPDKIVK
jgi:hypothetical protein